MVSVVKQEPGDYPKDLGTYGFFFNLDRMARVVPYWGHPTRDMVLRALRVDPSNTVTAGALANITSQIKQTSWQIKAGPRIASYYQGLLQNAQHETGWDGFVDALLIDWMYCDRGAFIEIVGPPDDTTRPLSGQVTQINILDSIRCFITGNREYPVWYQDHITGEMVKLHHTRIKRLTRMSSSNPAALGRGISLMSSALGVANLQMLMMKYQTEKLDDLPPAAFMTVSGMTQQQVNSLLQRHFANQQANASDVYGGIVPITGIDPENPPTINLTELSSVPENFDYDLYMRNHVYILALAIGVDPQDIWPLVNQGMGTATQSVILAEKGSAKTKGDIYKLIARLLNLHILPPSAEFEFQPSDTRQSQSEAQTAQMWSGIATDQVNAGIITPAQAQRMLANTIGVFADVLTDEAGELVRADDADVDEDVVADDETSDTRGRKDIQATRLAFEDAFSDALIGFTTGDLSRRRAGVVVRGLIQRYGNMAFNDGLLTGGVNPDDKSEADLQTIRRLVTSNSSYVTAMLNEVQGRELSAAAVQNKVNMWWNKSITPFFEAALESADRNGYYEWVMNPAKENCRDCQRLNSQIHRLRDWLRAGWKPKSSRLECEGYNCGCVWVKRSNVRARGRF